MTLPNDIRYAVRGLVRSPLFSLVAILSLGLGIGANTAIFTLIDQILLRRLPVKNPDELVMLYQTGPHNGSNMGIRQHSYPIYQEYQKRAEPLQEVLCRRLDRNVGCGRQPDRTALRRDGVGQLLHDARREPAMGRVFNSQEDDQTYSGHPVVVLGYDYWVRRFSRDPGVVGKKILVNNYPMTIVGVSAQGFVGLDPASAPQIRVPIQMKPVVVPEWEWVYMDNPRTRWVQVFARLKPGYTVESAAAPAADVLHPAAAARNDAARREGLVAVRARSVHEGSAARRKRRDRLLGPPQRVLDVARRADVHGRAGAADRLRECREPADRARHHAAARDCGPAVARRGPRSTGAAAPDRKPRALDHRRRARHLALDRADQDAPRARAHPGAAAPHRCDTRPAHPVVHDWRSRSRPA